MKAYGGSVGSSAHSQYVVVNGQLHSPAPLFPGNEPLYQFSERQWASEPAWALRGQSKQDFVAYREYRVLYAGLYLPPGILY